MAKIHIGLSGYDYKEWQGEGLFYPADLKKAKYLEYYASRFDSLEANGTFQRMPTEAIVAKWIDTTPPEFVVSPKMVQNVTHFKRLNAEAIELAQEFVKAMQPLEAAGKLGPIFVQLPPNLKRDDDRLRGFLAAMPHRKGLRWAIEFRNDSWNVAEVEEILKEQGIGWVAAETDEEEAQIRDTADFVFARLRKLEYGEDDLIRWAEFFQKAVAKGQTCYVYCRHKDTVAPWKWADRLRELMA